MLIFSGEKIQKYLYITSSTTETFILVLIKLTFHYSKCYANLKILLTFLEVKLT